MCFSVVAHGSVIFLMSSTAAPVAQWTSVLDFYSKVVGSSPTGGVFFFSFYDMADSASGQDEANPVF